MQAPHSFAFISEESLSRAMLAAQEDIKRRKNDAEKYADDVQKHQIGRQTKIVNSHGYVKKLNRRHQRDSMVSCILKFIDTCTSEKLWNFMSKILA